MTNAPLVTIARNWFNLIRFHLCLLKPQTPDYLTLGLLDTGFGAITHHCKGLQVCNDFPFLASLRIALPLHRSPGSC
uniref:Late blight resistance protein Rpi-blb2 n=1 Tax=Solanum tuberosum TaxID=4113 RepID=M1BV07_SOLTU